MKREDLKALGLTDEQIDKVLNMHHDEMKPVKDDLQKAQDDLTAAADKVKTTEDALKKFEGVDLEATKQQIEDLKKDLAQKDNDYQAQIADRDFQDILKDSIASAKGKNTKAIAALLDVNTLKKSKNQKEDIAAAIKALTEAEDSKMLFGEPEAKPTGTGSLIGKVGGNNDVPVSTLKDALKEKLG